MPLSENYSLITQGGVSKNSLQGDISSEENGGDDEFIELENIQQESGRGDEFIELEKVNEHLSMLCNKAVITIMKLGVNHHRYPQSCPYLHH